MLRYTSSAVRCLAFTTTYNYMRVECYIRMSIAHFSTYLDSDVHIGYLREHLTVRRLEPLLLQGRLATPLAAEHVQGEQRTGHLLHGSVNFPESQASWSV